jgi:ankyrin repeat protein
MAASHQNYPLFLELLQRGADPLADDTILISPLYPFRGGEYHSADAEQIVKRLLEGEVDPNRSGDGGQTPLCLAARFGQAGIVRALLEHGADPNRLDGDGYSPLMCALSPWILDVEQMGELVKLLVEAQADVNAPSPEGKLPLQLLMKLELETVPKSDFGPIIRYLQDRRAKTDLTGQVTIIPTLEGLPVPVIP